MRILGFGNSHVFAWQSAWEAMRPDMAGVEIDFFALPQGIFRRYRMRANGQFVPRRSVTAEERRRVATINGREACDLSAYDRAVWIGADWLPDHALALAAAGDPHPLATGPDRPALGAGFVQAALAEAAVGAMADWVADPALPHCPLVFGRPVYAETCLASMHALYAPWRDSAPFAAAARALLEAHVQSLTQAASARGLAFVAPPFDVLSGVATRAEFLAEGGGVVDPAARGQRGDHSHMNARYGRACIGRLLEHGLAGAG